MDSCSAHEGPERPPIDAVVAIHSCRVDRQRERVVPTPPFPRRALISLARRGPARILERQTHRITALLVSSALLLSGLTTGMTFLTAGVAVAGTATGCGTVLIPGSQWLQGQGVDVRSNGIGYGGSCGGGWSGYGYQCFDLASRIYAKFGWPMPRGMYAYQIPDNSAGLVFHPNGDGYAPAPGDLIVEWSTAANKAGHVAVVDTTQGSVVHAVEQNTQYLANGAWYDHPRHDYLFNGTTLVGGYGTVRGFEHAPTNHFSTPAPAGGGGPVKPDFNGDGRADIAWHEGSTLTTLTGQPNGTFSWAGATTGIGFDWIGAGDFRGDGKSQVAVHVGTDLVILEFNNGQWWWVNVTHGIGKPDSATTGASGSRR
jgi:hypothetical protein